MKASMACAWSFFLLVFFFFFFLVSLSLSLFLSLSLSFFFLLLFSSLQFEDSFSLSFSLFLLSCEGFNHRVSVFSRFFSPSRIGLGWFLVEELSYVFWEAGSSKDCIRLSNGKGKQTRPWKQSRFLLLLLLLLLRFLFNWFTRIVGEDMYPVSVKCSPLNGLEETFYTRISTSLLLLLLLFLLLFCLFVFSIKTNYKIKLCWEWRHGL